MAPRTSSRQAAQKAKEVIGSSAEAPSDVAAGSKRKAPAEKAPRSKKEMKEDLEPEAKPAENESDGVEGAPESMPSVIPGTKLPVDEQPDPKHARSADAGVDKPPETKAKDEPKPGYVPGTPVEVDQPVKHSTAVECGARKSEEREDIVSSNILEKGFIYFFFRPRVNVEDPHSVGDVARSFFVLRPTPLGAELDENQGPVDKDARCRLMILPKKKFPTSSKERDMGFVEKAGQSMKALQENFIASEKYETATRGERTTEEARPYAEGVYAITSTRRASHLAYLLTIPSELGEIQESFGLRERGSFIVQSKNPKYPGPSFAQLAEEPKFPESVREKFGDLRWVPLEPEFLEYPNSQFLMIGEAQNSLGKAATAEGGKQPHEEEPGQELEKLEQENEHRVDALQGDLTIFQDLGMDAKKHPTLRTTWNS